MSTSLTSKGKAWEYRNSLWMLWTLLTLGFLNYVSFFYIARKVKQKKWFRAGVVYSLFFIVFALASDSFATIYIISWIVSIFHIFKIRTEYLLRLEAVQASGLKNRELDKLKETIAREYDRPDSNFVSSDTRVEERAPIMPHNQPPERDSNKIKERNIIEKSIDINTASEKEISEVPGIGSIFATKVIAVRSQENGFKSFDHFVQTLSIKPHLAEKIKSHVFFSTTSHNEQRVKKTEGRIVDF